MSNDVITYLQAGRERELERWMRTGNAANSEIAAVVDINCRCLPASPASAQLDRRTSTSTGPTFRSTHPGQDRLLKLHSPNWCAKARNIGTSKRQTIGPLVCHRLHYTFLPKQLSTPHPRPSRSQQSFPPILNAVLIVRFNKNACHDCRLRVMWRFSMGL